MAGADETGSTRSTGVSRRGLIGGAGAGVIAAPFLAGRAEAAPMTGHGNRVTPGADVAAAQDWAPLAGTKLGVITNPTGISAAP